MGDLFTPRFSSLSGAGLFNTMRRYCPEEPLSSGLFFVLRFALVRDMLQVV
jgi:hypothetical protein